MNLRKLGERGFIGLIKKRFSALAPDPPLGIGDDAALIDRSLAGRGGLLISTDCLIETRHFRRDEPAYLLGRKALAVNLSDLAAMGASPVAFLLTLGLPVSLPPRFLELLVEGIRSAAQARAVPLVGGDTSMSPGPLVISITVLGRAARGSRGDRRAALTRAGARPGDGIYVSGALGASATGRLLLEAGWRPRLDASKHRLIGATPPRARGAAGLAREQGVFRTRALEALRAHLDPEPKVALGRALLRRGIASACIDLSDGLSLDLDRLCEASRAGARLLGPAIPAADCARALAGSLGDDPMRLALHGGEDYELLFTVPPPRERLLAGLSAVLIGRITPRARGVKIADARGRERKLPAGGFDHFAPSRARH